MTPNERAQRFATYVIFPLVLVAVAYVTYLMVDTIFFSYARGSMTVEIAEEPSHIITLNTCRLFRDAGNNPQLVISDGTSNGMKIYIQGRPSIQVTPILQGNDVPTSNCTITRSDLQLVRFSPGRTMKAVAESWKGSIEGSCPVPDGRISFTADVHACN